MDVLIYLVKFMNIFLVILKYSFLVLGSMRRSVSDRGEVISGSLLTSRSLMWQECLDSNSGVLSSSHREENILHLTDAAFISLFLFVSFICLLYSKALNELYLDLHIRYHYSS